ncbi:MAG: T9SS type A sorting domain-containing protein, partial [Bacteroidia bacterium]|nr:T9SS type A sorting domain-containing protein [Bacteroidia bacterium]
FDAYTNVHTFPNPVRPGYGNNVYISGLVNGTILKVTDVAGSVVWETKSQGGQVEWNLKTTNGTRVTSGVYMIYCATADGEQKAVTKLLVVN